MIGTDTTIDTAADWAADSATKSIAESTVEGSVESTVEGATKRATESAADFDANAFPLDPGIRLLEASAGTGKTFALAHLVLRLVTRDPDPLPLERLLVVTFTEAAATELRDRIARRLQEALALLDGADRDPPDPVLGEWLAAQPREAAAQRRLRGKLLLALEALDRADITTIHGFCRRTLQRQALEAGLGPAPELESDDGERALQVVHDHWQQQLLVLPAPLLAGLRQRGLSRERLQSLLRRLDADPALELDPLPPGLQADQPLSAQLNRWWQERWQTFHHAWQQRSADLEQALCAFAADVKARTGTSAKPYAARPRRNRLAEVQRWLDGLVAGLAEGPGAEAEIEAEAEAAVPGYDAVLAQPLLRDYFHPAPFARAARSAGLDPEALPERPLLEAIAALVDGPLEAVVAHALHWGRRELAQRRAASGRIGFGELLVGLDPGPDGQQHRELLEAVSQRYDVALIDEFQDTDPIQWRILERAFAPPAGAPASHLLVMVGDPKQAIYRFRGGELRTYLQARQRAGSAIYGLRENRRSAPGLVAALNRLMAPGLVRSALPVPEVLARSSHGELALEPQESPLQLLPLDDDERLPEQVAGLCLQLLRRHPLQPGDLCLLVSRHAQAELLRQALERRGLPSRLVSPGDVFATAGATALQRLLDGLADPGHAGRLRLLAASPLLGWSAAELAAVQAGQGSGLARWEALAERVAALAQQLDRVGLLACLGQLLGSEELARLSLGGRLLADLQQAAELVQEQMHRRGLGAVAAADWLRRQRLDPDRGEVPEAHQLHSDAADAAIAVVTVHRSKGLEFPVVICPYLWQAPASPKADAGAIGRRWWPPEAAAARLDLHISPHWGPGLRAAEDDHAAQLQERERLAYVASTRARHLLVLGWRQEAAATANPLAPWLGGPEDLPLTRLDPAALPAPAERWQPSPPAGELQPGPLPRQPLDTSWGRSSYSSWTHASGSSLDPLAADEGRDIDATTLDATSIDAIAAADLAADPVPDLASAEMASPATALVSEPPAPDGVWEQRGPLADFPRGPGPGEALHRILERLDYGQPLTDPAAAALISAELERAGLDPALTASVQQALELLRHTPFGGALGGFRLAELPLQQRLNEMNFDLPLAVAAPQARVRASGVARCFSAHPGGLFGPRYATGLAALPIASRGFLTGSIDLVFRQGERWWVLDWKSNWLGERDPDGAETAGGEGARPALHSTPAHSTPVRCGPAHYGPAAMRALMEASHYPLQAHLYLVALHRYLRWRLPGYRPEQHLGGYAYVFVRGVPGPLVEAERLAAQGGAVPGLLVDQPPLGRILALDALLQEGQP